jgi:hypothetical protein
MFFFLNILPSPQKSNTNFVQHLQAGIIKAVDGDRFELCDASDNCSMTVILSLSEDTIEEKWCGIRGCAV